MDLAKRDLLINTLKTQKREKEQFLLHNKRQLSERKQDNPHLNMVVEDYNDYFSLLQQEKEKQKAALQVLVDYLTNIIMEPASSAEMIKQSKHDKNIILGELKNL
jgi:hypothetical protein